MTLVEMIAERDRTATAVDDRLCGALRRIEDARPGTVPTVRPRRYHEYMTGATVDGNDLRIAYIVAFGGGDDETESFALPLALLDDPSDDAITAHFARLDAEAAERAHAKERAETERRRADDLRTLAALKAKYPNI